MAEALLPKSNVLLLYVSGLTGSLYRTPTESELEEFKSLPKAEREAKSPIREVNTEKYGIKYQYTYYRTGFGYIDSIAESTDSDFSVLKIRLKTSEGIEEVRIGSRNQSGGLTALFKSIISILPNLDFSKQYSISTKKSKDNKYVNIFFNYKLDAPDENGRTEGFVRASLTRKKEDGTGDIPQAKQVVVLGREKWDYTDQDNFLYSKFEETIARLNSYKANNKQGETSTTQESPNIDIPKSNVVNDVVKEAAPLISDEDDDLPF